MLLHDMEERDQNPDAYVDKLGINLGGRQFLCQLNFAKILLKSLLGKSIGGMDNSCPPRSSFRECHLNEVFLASDAAAPPAPLPV